MASKSKLLTLTLITSIIVILSVIVIKNISADNSEPVYVQPTLELPVKAKPKERTQHEELTFDATDPLFNANEITEQDRINHTKKVGSALNKTLMYDTPEKTLKAIMYYQDNNQEEKAAEFIDYLIKRFPDYQFKDDTL